MKHISLLISMVLMNFICPLSAINAASVDCPRGGVSEQDLSSGELILNDDDLVKISLLDQKSIKHFGTRKNFFVPTTKMIIKYHLKNQKGWRWVAVPSKGFFGRNSHEAGINFLRYTGITASYFPATKKVVISVMTPDVSGSQTFEFWVLVRVPNDFASITYDCGTFR